MNSLFIVAIFNIQNQKLQTFSVSLHPFFSCLINSCRNDIVSKIVSIAQDLVVVGRGLSEVTLMELVDSLVLVNSNCKKGY